MLIAIYQISLGMLNVCICAPILYDLSVLDKVCTSLYTCRCILVFCCSSPWEPFSRIPYFCNSQLSVSHSWGGSRPQVPLHLYPQSSWYWGRERESHRGDKESHGPQRTRQSATDFNPHRVSIQLFCMCVFFASALTFCGEPSSKNV